MRQDLVKVVQIQVFLHEHVEEVTESEVGESHEVADWLHDVPAEVVERPCENTCKLAYKECATQPEQRHCLSSRLVLEFVNLFLRTAHFVNQLLVLAYKV